MTRGHGWHTTEDFGDVFALFGECPGTSGPVGVVTEKVPVFLHSRAAAGGVDDDGVDVRGFEESNEIAGHAGGLVFQARVNHESPAAGLSGWGDDLKSFSTQHACSSGVYVGEKYLLNAAGEHADASASGGGGGYAFGHGPGEARGDVGEESFHGGELFREEPEEARGSDEGLQAGALIEEERAGEKPEPHGIWKSGEEKFAEEGVSGGAGNVALNLCATIFDELVVLDS